jgi:hypothetical protein
MTAKPENLLNCYDEEVGMLGDRVGGSNLINCLTKIKVD